MGSKIGSIPQYVVRNLSLFKQGLFHRPQDAPTKGGIIKAIEDIGLLQMDGINVVERSHYLILFSRLGNYDKDILDKLYWPDRKLLEQWAHVASIIPISHYLHMKPMIEERRKLPIPPRKLRRLGPNGNATLKSIITEIEKVGPLRSRDIGSQHCTKRKWWNRKPEREAMEILFRRGYIMVHQRINFERYYDLADRVFTDNKNFATGKISDWIRWSTIKGLSYQGVAAVEHIADYYRQPISAVRSMLQNLVEQGEVIPVKVEGWSRQAYICRADIALLDEKFIDQPHGSNVTTFLSPFDNLIWHRGRVEDIFGFAYRNEMYTPSRQRKYGYFVMPILHRGSIVGRMDPKVDRKNKTLIIKNMDMEKNAVVSGSLLIDVSRAIKEFMEFNECDRLSVEHAKPASLKSELLKRASG